MTQEQETQAAWDERYAGQHQMWSGNPNGALVVELAGLTPGRVLDVGCGEGADAVWLARGGWDVTALELSGVAIERAQQHARDAGVDITWVHSGFVDANLPSGAFDLVSALYPVLLKTPTADAERGLLDAVAVGGVLLFVHHADVEHSQSHDPLFDHANYVWPPMVKALFDDDWVLEVDERRPRTVPDAGAGAHHVDDLVLRARRLR